MSRWRKAAKVAAIVLAVRVTLQVAYWRARARDLWMVRQLQAAGALPVRGR